MRTIYLITSEYHGWEDGEAESPVVLGWTASRHFAELWVARRQEVMPRPETLEIHEVTRIEGMPGDLR